MELDAGLGVAKVAPDKKVSHLKNSMHSFITSVGG